PKHSLPWQGMYAEPCPTSPGLKSIDRPYRPGFGHAAPAQNSLKYRCLRLGKDRLAHRAADPIGPHQQRGVDFMRASVGAVGDGRLVGRLVDLDHVRSGTDTAFGQLSCKQVV